MDKQRIVSFRNELVSISKALPKIELHFVKNDQFVYQAGSRDYSHLLGFKHTEDLIGKSDFDVGWRDTCASICRSLDELVRSSRQAQDNLIEYVVSRKDAHGDARYAHLLIGYRNPILSKEGNFLGVYGASYSVTDMCKTEIEDYWQLNTKERFYLFPNDTTTYLTRSEGKFLFYWLNIPNLRNLREIGIYLHLTPQTIYTYRKLIREKLRSMPGESIHAAVSRTLFFDNFQYNMRR